jgi:transcriptional regulator with XRE-family HTH domain
MKARSSRVSAGARLKAWLDKNGLKQRDCAESLGVSTGAVSTWVAKGGSPDWHQRVKIERWTDGAIVAAEWESEREREDIARVEPYRPDAERKAS